VEQAVCTFCGKLIELVDLQLCEYCGGGRHDYCPPDCCKREVDEYVDRWLQELAEVEIERLNPVQHAALPVTPALLPSASGGRFAP
jgi:hypothetical protein